MGYENFFILSVPLVEIFRYFTKPLRPAGILHSLRPYPHLIYGSPKKRILNITKIRKFADYGEH